MLFSKIYLFLLYWQSLGVNANFAIFRFCKDTHFFLFGCCLATIILAKFMDEGW